MADIIVPWIGNHASIPAGWSRYTALDGKFPKASGAESAEATGGATTHTHTSSSHTHAIAAHTHTFTTGARSNHAANRAPTGLLSRKEHTHTGTSGAASGGTTDGTAVTYAAFSNNPPYYEVIFIKAASTSVPNDSIILWNQSSAPSNTSFKVTDGTASTVDLNGKYIKSAAAAGNAGGTGGTTTNTHSINHTHTTNTHTHANATTSGSSSIGGEDNSAGGNQLRDHTHSSSFSSTAQSINTYSTPLVTSETVEPSYTSLMAYQNKAGSAQNIPINGIAMTIDATLPTGWTLCDGTLGTTDLTDTFVKITTSSGSIGATGGANTHTHTAQNHTHTSTGGHTHTVTTAQSTAVGVNGIGGGAEIIETHTHDDSTSASTNATYAAGSTSAASSSNQPAYVVVKYIQKLTEGAGGAFLMMFADL